MLCRPCAIDGAQHQVDGQRAVFRTLPGEGKHGFHQLVGTLPVIRMFGPLSYDLRICLLLENLTPDFEIARDAGLAGGIELKPRHQ